MRLFTCAAGIAASVLVSASALAGVDTANPSLPPDTGAYKTPDQVHATYHGPSLEIILSNLIHQPFAATTVRTPVNGTDEQETFSSHADGQISINGSPAQPASMNGPTTTLVHNKLGNVTGTFNTEMLQLNLSGNSPFGPFMIRESPTLASLGQTSITPIGGGMFHIDSFFDVFTELSLDGGNSWIPSDTSTHVVLDPEPAAIGLLAPVLLLAARKRRSA